MASSGSFQNTFRTGYTLRVEWSTTSQSVANNTSTVQVKAYLVSGGSSYTINSSATKTLRLIIDGTTYTKSEAGLASLGGNEKKLLYSKSVTISHSSDGSKEISISCEFDIEVTLSGTYIGTAKAPASGSATATLDTIARATTPTTSGTFNVGGTVTINLPRAASAFTHTVQYSLNNSSWTTIQSNVGTSVSWTLPSALASAKPSSTTGTVYIRAITYNGSTNIGSKTISRTFNITSSYAAPSVSISISQSNAGGINQYVRGKSSVTITATASLKYSATAKTYVFSYGGSSKTVSTTNSTASVKFTLPSNAAESYSYSVELTDSRGYKASKSNSVTTVSYTVPRIVSLSVVRGDYVDDVFTENRKGNSLKIVATGTITSLSDSNAKKWGMGYRLYADTAYTILYSDQEASSYSVSVTKYTSAIFSENSAYVIRFTLEDSFGSVSQIIDVPSQRVLMNFSSNGKAMNFGGIAETDDVLQISFPAYFTGGIKPIELPEGADLNEILTSGSYIIGSTSISGTILNKPSMASTGTALIEVFAAGNGIQKIQRFTLCDKDDQYIFQRIYYTSAWGDWMLVGGCSAWKNLTIDSAFSVYSSTSQPKYRINGNVITVTGAVSPTTQYTSSTTKVTFASGLPTEIRPSEALSFVCQGSGMNRWTCGIETDGTLTVSRYGTTSATTVPTSAWLTFCCTYSI